MRAFAYRLLGRREYSLQELSNRISRKWPQAYDVNEFILQLEKENLVSDQRFAESFLRSRVQRHQGPLKIKAELRGKGVADSIISDALETMSEEWAALAAQWLTKYHSGDFSFKEKQKYYRRLVNRGFTHNQAMDALNKKERA
jgi:regulatory protein